VIVAVSVDPVSFLSSTRVLSRRIGLSTFVAPSSLSGYWVEKTIRVEQRALVNRDIGSRMRMLVEI
tara:strand:- start:2325 stop:2522 length:198 start_codon:yes stop_codon:yes gene_type:complete